MNRLHELIRRLPPGVEMLVVVSWAFGLPIFSSIMSFGAGQPAATGGTLVFNNSALLGILVFELAQSVFLVWFLQVRGWTLQKIGLNLTWRNSWHGWLLMLATYALALGAQELLELAMPAGMEAATQRYPKAAPNLSMQLVFLVSTVNGIFEEVFVAGYLITALKATRGAWMAINVSTVIRLLYHLYQGPIGMVTVVPMGLLYGYVYVRNGQLWPLIFAHVVIDIIGLSAAALN